jgi:hypothetical protein
MRESTGGWYTVTRLAAVERIDLLDRQARRLIRCAELSALLGLLCVGAAVLHLLRWPWAALLLVMFGAAWWLLIRMGEATDGLLMQLARTSDEATLARLIGAGSGALAFPLVSLTRAVLPPRQAPSDRAQGPGQIGQAAAPATGAGSSH